MSLRKWEKIQEMLWPRVVNVMMKELQGFRFAVTCAGIKQSQRPDMVLMIADPPARWSGVFTTNRVKAAPVLLGIDRLKKGGPLSAILANSGNANACVGKQGMENALTLCRETARLLEVPEEQVLMASTGIIGQPLPVTKMMAAVPDLVQQAGTASLEEVATALMTTDRYPKWEIATLDHQPPVNIAGAAKGAGMIHPHMATMLGFFFMNAGIPSPALDLLTKRAAGESFNRITVDGDQSTNDTVLVLDNGSAPASEELTQAVSGRLAAMMQSLAWKIVDNGEGVTKVVTLQVTGARDEDDARKVAESVGHSPLVKTAFYGQDPNWGRIMAAIGYSGAAIDPEKVRIVFEDTPLVMDGQGMGTEAEKKVTEIMKKRAYTLRIDLNRGKGTWHLITSDLSVEYVKINADYRS